jgi:hypothetical protein
MSLSLNVPILTVETLVRRYHTLSIFSYHTLSIFSYEISGCNLNSSKIRSDHSHSL